MVTNFCKFFLPSSLFPSTSFKTVIALMVQEMKAFLMSKVTDSIIEMLFNLGSEVSRS